MLVMVSYYFILFTTATVLDQLACFANIVAVGLSLQASFFQVALARACVSLLLFILRYTAHLNKYNWFMSQLILQKTLQ